MVITRYTVKGPKLKAAVVADLHGQPTEKLVVVLQAEQPDVILIPGDLCTIGEYAPEDVKRRERSLGEQERVLAFLKTVASVAPIFYARGNHEWGMDDTYREAVKATGTVLLENEWVRFSDVWIGGQNSAQRCGLEKLTDELKPPKTEWLKDSPDGFRILLCHHPEYYALVEHAADLVLSGHAHGGQWQVFHRGVFAPGQGIFPKYSRGQYGKMILSAGLTNTTPLIPRFFNPTELVIVEIGQ